MNKKYNHKMCVTVAAVAICAAMLAGCGGAAAGTDASTETGSSHTTSGVAPVSSPTNQVSAGIAGDSGEYITQQQAQAAALEHAGLAEADVQFLSTRLDYDDGRAEYDVEFICGNEEYDYNIDALTGEVLSMDREVEYYSQNQQSAANGATLTADEAKQIALQHAGIDEASTTRMEISFDYDDGRAVYEVEWKVDRTEYQYDIDANTGDILSYEHDMN